MEVNVYKKFGVAINSTNNWAIYRNVAIDVTSVNTSDLEANPAEHWDSTQGYGI